MTGKSFFVYAQKFSAGLCIFPLQSSALLFCHTQLPHQRYSPLVELKVAELASENTYREAANI
ncbi:hypothetical protein, partial [Heyndrickxia coagulans]|uniref:hypothetical protein n=1 Tax=Heyndrickxia coagulans TaxID=1398 RepID=UPI0012BAE6EE